MSNNFAPTDTSDCNKQLKRCVTGPNVGQVYNAEEPCLSGSTFDPSSCLCESIPNPECELSCPNTNWKWTFTYSYTELVTTVGSSGCRCSVPPEDQVEENSVSGEFVTYTNVEICPVVVLTQTNFENECCGIPGGQTRQVSYRSTDPSSGDGTGFTLFSISAGDTTSDYFLAYDITYTVECDPGTGFFDSSGQPVT